MEDGQEKLAKKWRKMLTDLAAENGRNIEEDKVLAIVAEVEEHGEQKYLVIHLMYEDEDESKLILTFIRSQQPLEVALLKSIGFVDGDEQGLVYEKEDGHQAALNDLLLAIQQHKVIRLEMLDEHGKCNCPRCQLGIKSEDDVLDKVKSLYQALDKMSGHDSPMEVLEKYFREAADRLGAERSEDIKEALNAFLARDSSKLAGLGIDEAALLEDIGGVCADLENKIGLPSGIVTQAFESFRDAKADAAQRGSSGSLPELLDFLRRTRDGLQAVKDGAEEDLMNMSSEEAMKMLIERVKTAWSAGDMARLDRLKKSLGDDDLIDKIIEDNVTDWVK